MRAVLAFGLAATLLSACGPSAEVQRQLDSAQSKSDELAKGNAKLETENTDLIAKVRRLEAEVDRLRKREVYYRLGIEEGQDLSVTFVTSMGDISCALWPDKAPQTVLNFVELAEGSREWTDPRTGRRVTRPLYDGTIFHRVIPGFMIQGGDPLGNGTGGPGYKFDDEIDAGLGFDQPGLLAMANSGPDTNGSQFFITDRSTPSHLDGKHTIFGKCDNLDTVAAIADTESGARDRPLKDVVLERVRVRRGK
ncbi:MAG: hypothetical protein GXP62_06070 [Oligoflexia bacterium]|nr:hypothetical protein [Oligoflexia bacterium]